ncbi:MAG: M20 family metallo-hydrolase [Ginsengibacter sp.]
MSNYLFRANKILGRIDELAKFSEEENSLTRLFGTKSFIDCSAKIVEWMNEAGLATHTDNIGNIRGKLASKNFNAKTFVIASHFDTTLDSGKFDGVMGILSGLDIAENIIEQNINLPFHLEIIAFSTEEGARFHAAYVGSSVIAGTFDKRLLKQKDDQGISLKEALEALNFNPAKIESNKMPEEEWLGYLEIHTEQGPVLYEKNIPVGIVTAIAGQKKIEIIFRGESGHAGTVPMNMRVDALCAAAQFIVAVEEYASHEKRNMVATVGKINVQNPVSNIIPASVFCTLDIRSSNASSLSKVYEAINKMCEAICHKRKIYFEWKLVQESAPSDCDADLLSILSKSIKRKNIDVVKMVSGGGHDAVAISKVSPVAMLFVKCYKGISHSPLENVEVEDIAVAIDVADSFIIQVANEIEKHAT